jgi:hypothetical protein
MASIAADSADDVGCEVLLLRAIVLAMSDLSAVLASLVLIITECTVQGGELTKLVALELVLSFWNGSSLRTNV